MPSMERLRRTSELHDTCGKADLLAAQMEGESFQPHPRLSTSVFSIAAGKAGLLSGRGHAAEPGNQRAAVAR